MSFLFPINNNISHYIKFRSEKKKSLDFSDLKIGFVEHRGSEPFRGHVPSIKELQHLVTAQVIRR